VTGPNKRADRRVERSQKLLRDALKSLVSEKDYDEIAVQEIIDRANVGRSTFYTHFRDKDELLVSGIHEMIGSVPLSASATSGKQYEKLLWFSLPIFKAIGYHRYSGEARMGHPGEARMGRKGQAVLHAHLQSVLARRIADEVKKDLASRTAGGPIPRDLLVPYVASTFILVLDWWVASRRKLSPEEVNDLFRALVLPALAAGWGS
jgi:AcrR family transcriptional regulator